VGDSVRWINDDSYDFPLTIVSNEGLWTGRTGRMRYQTGRFDYTFNRTGIYTFSIEECPHIENQTITVEPRLSQ
jgi:plastocyanin